MTALARWAEAYFPILACSQLRFTATQLLMRQSVSRCQQCPNKFPEARLLFVLHKTHFCCVSRTQMEIVCKTVCPYFVHLDGCWSVKLKMYRFDDFNLDWWCEVVTFLPFSVWSRAFWALASFSWRTFSSFLVFSSLSWSSNVLHSFSRFDCKKEGVRN